MMRNLDKMYQKREEKPKPSYRNGKKTRPAPKEAKKPALWRKKLKLKLKLFDLYNKK